MRALGALLYECLLGEDPPESDVRSERGARERLEALAGGDALERVIGDALWAEPAPRAARLADALADAPGRARAATEPPPGDAPGSAPDWPEEIDRRGTIAGAAILLLVVTNLGWLLYTASIGEPLEAIETGTEAIERLADPAAP